MDVLSKFDRLLLIGANLVACGLIALIIWSGSPTTSFGVILVHSIAIGMTAMFLIRTTLAWLYSRYPDDTKPSVVLVVSLVAFLALPAFLIGTLVARVIVGLPLLPLFPEGVAIEHRSLGVTVVAALVISGAFYAYEKFISIRLEASAAREQAAVARQQATDAQLAVVRAQIDPHMLFNTLANLRAMIRIDADGALAMTDRLIAFLKASLAGSRQQMTTVEAEFRMLGDYLALMKIRLGERLSYSVDVEDGAGAMLVPSFMLQPIVENALRHGVEPAVGPVSVDVKARSFDTRLQLTVADTGVGISDQAIAKLERGADDADIGGLGLYQLSERLNHLYAGQGHVQIERREGGGTVVLINLPIDVASKGSR